MEQVQKEIDDAYLIAQFEEGLRDGGTGADKDVIFNNNAAMLFLAELKYKSQNANMLMNRPSHVCHAKSGCMMEHKVVTVYRKVHWTPNVQPIVTADSNVFTTVFGAESNPSQYQVCFGDDECEHAKTGHYCDYIKEQGVNCHHLEKYHPSNVRRLKDFWVCNETGNVHACGAMCQQQKVMSVYENDYVCSLTGTVTGRNIVNDNNTMTRQSLLLENSGAALIAPVSSVFDDTKSFRTTVKDKGSTYRRKKADNSSSKGKVAPDVNDPIYREQYEKSLKWWENETEMAANKMVVDYVVEELFFSKRRQMLEADSYLNGYKDAYEEVSKYMRTKKQQHQQQETEQTTINTIMALCIFQYRIPTNMYFKNVPMMPSVRRYILNGIAKLDASFIANNGVDISFCDDDCGGRDFDPVNVLIKKIIMRKQREEKAKRKDNEENWDNLDNDDDDDDNDDDEDDNDIDLKRDEQLEEQQMLQKWHNKATIVKRMFSVATISIWRNINKNLHELKEFDSMFKFKKILLPLLYMLRKQFIITENLGSALVTDTGKVYEPFADVDMYDEVHFSEKFSKANKLCVNVIPKIEFASLLPIENQLYKFDLSRDIISEHYMQSEIMRAFGYEEKPDDLQTIKEKDGKKKRVTFTTSSTSMSAIKAKSRVNTNVRRDGEKPRITVAGGGILIMRKITKMHTEIKKIIKYIARYGRLSSMQLRMEDISSEIINKTDDMVL